MMTNARLLSLLLFLLTCPAVGLSFLLGFIGGWIVGLATAAVIIVIVIWTFESSPRPDETIRIDVLLFSLAISFALCLLGGEGRLFYANSDWLIRDAVINDLVSQPWPFVYRVGGPNFIEQTFIMRAPLAMYMLPAAIGKIYGIYAAHLTLLAQNTILFGLIFYFVVPAHLRFWPAATTISIFALFSGLDVVPTIARYMLTGNPPSDHIEWWVGLFQYSSHITQLFWVPHHAIAGWGFACLYLLWHRGRVRVSLLVCTFLYLAYWSSLAVIGAVPFVAYAAMSDLIGRKIGRFDVIFLLLSALPTTLLWIYLIQDAATVEHYFLIGAQHFWSIFLVFICVEFMPFVVLIVAMKPIMIRDHSFLLVVISLLLIPLYKLGQYNDFAMRASIPALALLAASFSIMLAENFGIRRRLLQTSVAVLTLSIGSITGFMEIRRALIRSPSPMSRCNVTQVFPFIPTHYLANLNGLPEWMHPQSPVQVPAGTISMCFTRLRP